MKKSNKITIQFCCKKIDGWIEKFTKKDKIDPLSRAKFFLSWNDGEGLEPSIIKKVELLDSGLPDESEITFDKNCLYARFCPIVRFHLKKKVDEEEFRKSVWESYVKIDFEEDTLIWEDHQGYTAIFDESDLDYGEGISYTLKQLEQGISLQSEKS